MRRRARLTVTAGYGQSRSGSLLITRPACLTVSRDCRQILGACNYGSESPSLPRICLGAFANDVLLVRIGGVFAFGVRGDP